MFLSRIKLNTAKPKTMRALSAPCRIHGAVESCEKDSRSRKLWRIDSLGGEQYLLVLTETELDLSSVEKQFGYGEPVETRSYDKLLNRIENGSRWSFRLKANPVIRRFKKDPERGKVMAHITPEFQMKWLKDRCEGYGFSLSDGECLVTGSQWYNFKKGNSGQRVKMLAVTFEGMLTVTDKELFKKALVNGIGREKAYGLGLLTIAGVR